MSSPDYRPIEPGSTIGVAADSDDQRVRWSTRFVVAAVSSIVWMVAFLAIAFALGRLTVLILLAYLVGILVLVSGVAPRVAARMLPDAARIWPLGLGAGMFAGAGATTIAVVLSSRFLFARPTSLLLPLLSVLAGVTVGGALGATPRPRGSAVTPDPNAVKPTLEADETRDG